MSGLVSVAAAGNEPEAELICQRLAQDGIPAISRPAAPREAPQFGAGARRDVYVEERFAARARELLAAPQFSDEELAALSEEAGRALGADSPGLESS